MGFVSSFLLVFLFQAFPVKSFLLNTDKPPLLNSSGPTAGYDANTIAYFFQKVDYLQLQIKQQNKTIETQATMIQQLLNITQQSPSTASLSNDLSILQMYVRRIMDEYHRLSNISDATDLALKINSMANSVRILTTSLTSQSNLINQLENQHQRMEDNLNRVMNLTNGLSSTHSLQNEVSVLGLNVQHILEEYQRLSKIANATYLAEKINSMANSLRVVSTSLITQENKMQQMDTDLKQQNQALNETLQIDLQSSINSISSIQQTLTTLSSRVHSNDNKLSSLSSDSQSTKSTIVSLQSTVAQTQRDVSNQISTMTTQNQNKLEALSNDMHSARNSISSVQNALSQDQNSISSLSRQYSTLSGQLSNSLSTLKTNITSLDTRLKNLEVGVISNIRLTGGSHIGEGRVEVLYQNRWGTVCDDAFDDTDAQVVCRQLGYAWTGAIQKQSAPYGQGTGTIVLDNVHCRGPETSIASCIHNGYTKHNCGHSEDVGVVCFSVRLTGGSNSREGRVIVRLGNTDGSVCDDSWDNDDARVVCRMLGYHGTAEAVSSARFGQGSGQIWMDDVNCGGSETSLAECSFNGNRFGSNNCVHDEDAGVICH